MNAKATTGSMRPRGALHLRALRALHRLLLRLLAPRCSRVDRFEISRGVFAAEPGDEIRISIYTEERVTTWQLDVLRETFRDA